MHELNPNEIHFFHARPHQITDPDLLAKFRSVLSDREKAKTDRYMFEKDRHNCLVTRAQLRYLLSQYTGKGSKDFRFIENRYGKPELKPGIVDLPIRFNLSHSSTMTVCAMILDNDLGVDVEDTRRKIELDIADRFFSAREAREVRQCPEKDRQKLFFDFWTLKEAYIKARGMGLSIPLDSFSFTLTPGDIGIQFHDSPSISPKDVPKEVGTALDWQFNKFSPSPEFTVSLAVRISRNKPVKLLIHECLPFQYIRKIKDLNIG